MTISFYYVINNIKSIKNDRGLIIYLPTAAFIAK